MVLFQFRYQIDQILHSLTGYPVLFGKNRASYLDTE